MKAKKTSQPKPSPRKTKGSAARKRGYRPLSKSAEAEIEMMVLSTINEFGGLPHDLMGYWAKTVDCLEDNKLVRSLHQGVKMMTGSAKGELFWSFSLTHAGLLKCAAMLGEEG